jgi:hypothetical protein
MIDTLPWIIALSSAAVLMVILAVLVLSRRKPTQKPLPTDWALSARPVFSTDERRVYRQLREALPHHIVLSKLPLVRFSQPTDPQDVRYWYELLGSIHVTFAICSANGRVLAAIDLDTDRGNSRRVLQIKQSVLGACRVRYLRCPVDHLPSIPELQLLVPQSAASSRGPQPAPLAQPARSSGSSRRSKQRPALWQDSGFFQDSFFSPDNRMDASVPSQFGSLSDPPSGRAPSRDMPLSENDDVAGAAAADAPRYGVPTRH